MFFLRTRHPEKRGRIEMPVMWFFYCNAVLLIWLRGRCAGMHDFEKKSAPGQLSPPHVGHFTVWTASSIPFVFYSRKSRKSRISVVERFTMHLHVINLACEIKSNTIYLTVWWPDSGQVDSGLELRTLVSDSALIEKFWRFFFIRRIFFTSCEDRGSSHVIRILWYNLVRKKMRGTHSDRKLV